MCEAYQSCPVVDKHGFLVVCHPVENPFELAVGVFGVVFGGGVDRYAAFDEGRGDVVLDEERTWARHGDIGPGLGQHDRQVGRLRLDGQGDTDPDAVEGAVFQVPVADDVQDRRVLGGPVDLPVAVWGERGIFHLRFLHAVSSGLGFRAFVLYHFVGCLNLFASAEHKGADEDDQQEGDKGQPDAGAHGERRR